MKTFHRNGREAGSRETRQKKAVLTQLSSPSFMTYYRFHFTSDCNSSQGNVVESRNRAPLNVTQLTSPAYSLL